MVFSPKIIRILKFHPTLTIMNYFGKINSFVQVGAHDGEMHDPLRRFILKNNWNGILIEPQKNMLEKCQNNYQNKDKLNFENIAVHPTKSKITLYKVENPKDYSHTGWASINLDRFNNTIYKDSITEELIPAMHLMKVIKNYNFCSVDLLQIDTEGFDSEVIKMFDFSSLKPALIQYEHVHLSKNEKLATLNTISSYGYYLIEKKNDTIAVRKDIINSWFIFVYIIFRIYDSVTSRLSNLFNVTEKVN